MDESIECTCDNISMLRYSSEYDDDCKEELFKRTKLLSQTERCSECLKSQTDFLAAAQTKIPLHIKLHVNVEFTIGLFLKGNKFSLGPTFRPHRFHRLPMFV